MSRFVVFTDLDGTLLDHHTYDWRPARAALERLKATGTPLIMVSSKTRVEIEAWRADLDNHDPFIPENGAAILIPEGYDLDLPAEVVEINGYRAVLLGRRASEIAPAFDQLAARWPLRALSRLDAAELAALTGLTRSQAEAARKREFGEAFLLDDPAVPEAELEAAALSLGLRLTRGGRFYHLLGENDKGRAVSVLAGLYRQKYPSLTTAALGDAPNDQPMLAAVDRAYLVARPDGSHGPVDAPGLTRVPWPGPAGFNRAVLTLLEET